MATLKDLKKKLEEAQSNVASLEKKIEQRTPSVNMSASFKMHGNDKMIGVLRSWTDKYHNSISGYLDYEQSTYRQVPTVTLEITAKVTPDMLRSLADMMEENV